MSKVKQAIYAQDKDMQVWLEEIDGSLFVHVHLYNFSKEVLTRMRLVWDHLSTAAYFDGREEIFTYTKDARVPSLIGGAVELAVPKELSGRGFRMYKWELK